MARSKAEKAADKFIEGVSTGKIKRMRNLSGTHHYFGYDNKAAFDAAGITDGQMVEYIKRTMSQNEAVRKVKMEEAVDAVERFEKTEGDWKEKIEANVRALELQIKEKVAWYLEDFEVPVGTDEDNLKNLAAAQLRLEKINDTRLFEMAKPVEMQTTKSARDIFSNLADEEKGLLAQIRLLQGAMGLDRPTRDRKSLESTGVDRVQAIVAAAKEFLSEEIKDICHCGIRIAWVARFFPEEPLFIRTRCPRCGGVIEYGEKPQDII